MMCHPQAFDTRGKRYYSLFRSSDEWGCVSHCKRIWSWTILLGHLQTQGKVKFSILNLDCLYLFLKTLSLTGTSFIIVHV